MPAEALSPAEAFADDFAAQFPDLGGYVGVAVVGVGATTPPFVAGDRTPRPALGTLTLPLALAALEHTNDGRLTALVEQAVGDPRSAAVGQLWAALGGGDTAAFAVQRTLNKESVTPAIVDEPSLARAADPATSDAATGDFGFGHSAWDVEESARFAAALSCRPGGAAILSSVGPAISISAMGSANQTTFRDVRVVEAQALLRQVSVVYLGEKFVGAALSVRARDEPAALAIVERVETWLTGRLDTFPGATCAARGRTAAPTASPSAARGNTAAPTASASISR